MLIEVKKIVDIDNAVVTDSRIIICGDDDVLIKVPVTINLNLNILGRLFSCFLNNFLILFKCSLFHRFCISFQTIWISK